MTRLVADFEATHPGVRVQWSDVAFDAMRRKVFAAGAAGMMPDVVNFSDQHFAQFANLGALRPLADLLPGEPSDRYVAGSLEACRVNDALVALPWYLSTTVRVMNRRLLADGGLTTQSVGASWDALLDQAGPFKAKSGRFLFTLPLGDRSDLPMMLLADGVDVFAVDPAGGLRAQLTSPAVVAFVQRWADAYANGLLPRSSATGGYQEMVAGLTGETVALVNANALARVKAEAPQVYAELEVGPGVVGALGVPSMAVTTVSVSRQSKHPELAAELAWHVTSPRWQTELAVEAGRSPSTIESLLDPAFIATSEDPQAIATELGIVQLPTARAFAPATATWPDLRRVFDEGMKQILLAAAGVASTMAWVEADWNRILRADAAGETYQ